MDRSYLSSPTVSGTSSPRSRNGNGKLGALQSGSDKDRSYLCTPSVSGTSSPRSRNGSGKLGALRSGSETGLSSKLSTVSTVLKTQYNSVERFGLPVPVLVEEAFSHFDRNTVITARISECGYAWVVAGRRLFIWQYQSNVSTLVSNGSPKQRTFSLCHELKLPQSDLAHRAELVSVFVTRGSNNASCVAVSPEGMVRYWPDIAHDHTSVDQHVDLNGQECDSMVDINGLGCVFVTTTCTVVLVQHKKGNYGHQLTCRTLKTNGNWLGGLSKRVSSIFFGPMTSDTGSETRIIRLLAVPSVQQIYSVYVLAGLTLQKWILSENEPEQMAWGTDLSRSIKEAFRVHIAHWDICDRVDIDVWILDIQPDREGVLMLCAGVYLQMSPQVYYALVSIPTHGTVAPTQPKDFLLIKFMSLYRDDNTAEALNFKFILCGSTAYIYSAKSIVVIKPQEDPDTLDFLHPIDHIFSGVVCLNVPIFFSRTHGLVAVTSADSECTSTLTTPASSLDTSFNDPTCSNNLTVYLMDPYEIYNAHKDTTGQLKAAFIFHVKNQLSECYDMVNKLFPSDIPTLPGVDNPLDTVVITISKNILDDVPAGDPRWSQGEKFNQGLGSSHSMLVLHQLIDKQKAHALYLKFLRDSGLWDKLCAVTVRETSIATIFMLGELSEKIAAGIIMKNLPASALFEDAIQRAVQNYSTEVGAGLSQQDVFYREVTRIHEAILWLSKICEEASHSSSDPLDIARTIHEGNQIIVTVLNEVIGYRQMNAELFVLNDIETTMNLEYLPWTVAGEPEGVIDSLMSQHSLTTNYGLKVTTDSQLKHALLEDFVMLADLILDGRKTHLASVKNSAREKALYKQYCSDRTKLIKPLLTEKAWEKAAMLAEKYLDFEILMTICEQTQSEDRLDEYMRRFKDSDFSEYVYNWYLKEGKQAKLLDRYRKVGGRVPEGQEKLSKFLGSYPTLSWIQQTFDEDFTAAAITLSQLAQQETELVVRQKTMLSLSKLAKLTATDDSDLEEHIEDVNKRLELIYYQEQIPDYVLQQYGYDSIKPRVLTPKDIIGLYICPEYTDANELDFIRALTVADFVEEDTERVEIVLQIWRSALLRDTWDFPNLDSPLECLQNTLFFRLVDFSIALGSDPNTLLPPVDMLMNDKAMSKLNNNKNFLPLLKMGFEHFHRTQLM